MGEPAMRGLERSPGLVRGFITARRSSAGGGCRDTSGMSF